VVTRNKLRTNMPMAEDTPLLSAHTIAQTYSPPPITSTTNSFIHAHAVLHDTTLPCTLCGSNTLPRIPYSSLNAQSIRHLKRTHPSLKFTTNSLICTFHIALILHTRIQDLLTEDASTYSNLQVSPYKTLIN